MKPITLGVVSDTHIPDRAADLHPLLLATFRGRAVDAILHAGDICVPRVLQTLAEIAPVYAVRGNRDIFYLRHLPVRRILTFNNIPLGLIHGHGNLYNYLIDRLRYQVQGLDLLHFKRRARDSFPDCRIIVFGHIHHPIQEWSGGQLLFNPGSACCPDYTQKFPSAGLLTLDASGQITPEIFYLK